MDHKDKGVPIGQHWVPWVGLALVLPAVTVLLIGVSALLFNTQRAPNGWLVLSGDPGVGGVGGGLFVVIAAFLGLILGCIGVVRGYRRNYSPRDGSSIRIAGGVFEIGVVILALVALLSLGFIVI